MLDFVNGSRQLLASSEAQTLGVYLLYRYRARFCDWQSSPVDWSSSEPWTGDDVGRHPACRGHPARLALASYWATVPCLLVLTSLGE
jgi:hypothetical protein